MTLFGRYIINVIQHFVRLLFFPINEKQERIAINSIEVWSFWSHRQVWNRIFALNESKQFAMADEPSSNGAATPFVQELAPRRRNATSNLRRARQRRPDDLSRQRRRAKIRSLASGLEDDPDASMAASSARKAGLNQAENGQDIDFDDDDDEDNEIGNDNGSEDPFQDDNNDHDSDEENFGNGEDVDANDDDDTGNDIMANDNSSGEGGEVEDDDQDEAESDMDSLEAPRRRATPQKSKIGSRTATMRNFNMEDSMAGMVAVDTTPRRRKQQEAADIKSEWLLSSTKKKIKRPLFKRTNQREEDGGSDSDSDLDSDTGANSRTSTPARSAGLRGRKNNKYTPLSQVHKKQQRRLEPESDSSVSEAESDLSDSSHESEGRRQRRRARKKRRQENEEDGSEQGRTEGRAEFKLVKPRATCLDIVANLANVLIDEYAEELEQRGRPEYSVFLDRFLEEIKGEFDVYNKLAFEFASHTRFSRALTQDLQNVRESLAWMQKQRIRAERLVSAKRAELNRRLEAKKRADAAEAYLARLRPKSA